MDTSINTGAQLARILTTCSSIFESTDRFAVPDRVIAAAIYRFRGNDTIDAVLPKVILINSFYATQIYDTERAARNILTVDADSRLASGDLTLVDSIRRGHGIKTKKSGRERDFYSFATKYAALHEPTKFPIFDSLVMKLLTQLDRQLKFCSHFTQADLRDYRRYVTVIDSLIQLTNLKSFKYKRLDQGSWVYAKYLFDSDSLSTDDNQTISRTEMRNGTI